MKLTIENDRLTITADRREQATLRRLWREHGELFNSDDFAYEMLEKLFTDNCFSWISSDWTGDLTSAPMLAIQGDEEPLPPPNEHGDHYCMGIMPTGSDTCQPILYRWAFMNYAVTSPQRDLCETGKAVFDGGALAFREGQMELQNVCHFTAQRPSVHA